MARKTTWAAVGRSFEVRAKRTTGAITAAHRKTAREAVGWLRGRTLAVGIKPASPYFRGWYAKPLSLRAVKIGNTQPYANFVETGRASGKAPPVDALLGWVRRVLHLVDGRRAAFLIARSIGRRGLRPRPVWKFLHARIAAAFRAAEKRAVRAVQRSTA